MPDYHVKVTINAPIALPGVEAGETITEERLVRAKNEARAIAHIVKDTITIAKASTDEIIRLCGDNVELEIAE